MIRAISEDGTEHNLRIGFPVALRARYCRVMRAKPYS